MASTDYFAKKIGHTLGAISSAIIINLIKIYQFWLSPWIGQHCRFYPSCSSFAIEAIQVHGSLQGMGFTLKRLARCHPWCSGGHDPVPPKKKVVI